MLEKTQSHIAWCNEYIEYFRKNCDFDPLAALSETENRDQAMFNLCCQYLYGIENSLDKVNAMFEAERNSIVYKDRRQTA